MKKIILLIALICSVNSFSQETSKWRVGGGIGLGFGSGNRFSLAVSPSLGYENTPMLEAGATAGYQYAKNGSLKQNVFSFGPYVNFYPVKFLFLRTHFEHHFGSEKYINSMGESKKYNFDESALWLGGGYRSSGRVQFYGGLMYNVLYKEGESIFSSGFSPILGVSFGF